MRQVRADFVQPTKPSMVSWTCAVGLFMFSLAAVVTSLSEWNLARERSEQVQAAIASRDQPPAPPPALPPKPYDTNAHELLVTRSFAWADALTMLESTAVVGVTVTQVDFASADHAMRVEVNFTDYPTVLDYLNALNAAAPMIHWSLSQTQGQSAGGMNATAVLLGVAASR